MTIVAAIAGVALIAAILWEGFEVMILPRRVSRRFRFSVSFLRAIWRLMDTFHRLVSPRKNEETWLSIYGPLSLILLLGVWAFGLVLGFALLYWAAGSNLHAGGGHPGFHADFYMSGTTFFTLGIGDVTPASRLGRALVMIESGLGFGFLALIISYLPPLNQSFALRESSISLLDARAGSPATAAELLRRHSRPEAFEALPSLLHEWERWSAELLETHLSYPVLAYFRSQHSNQSWLATLTAILDACALIKVDLEGACRYQAQLTFAMARHTVVDLSLVFQSPPKAPPDDRLPPEKTAILRASLEKAGLELSGGENADAALRGLRATYEPYLYALAIHFHLPLPPWMLDEPRKDNWQADPWKPRKGRATPPAGAGSEHFWR